MDSIGDSTDETPWNDGSFRQSHQFEDCPSKEARRITGKARHIRAEYG
jgi:hypothetical protein